VEKNAFLSGSVFPERESPLPVNAGQDAAGKDREALCPDGSGAAMPAFPRLFS